MRWILAPVDVHSTSPPASATSMFVAIHVMLTSLVTTRKRIAAYRPVLAATVRHRARVEELPFQTDCPHTAESHLVKTCLYTLVEEYSELSAKSMSMPSWRLTSAWAVITGWTMTTCFGRELD